MLILKFLLRIVALVVLQLLVIAYLIRMPVPTRSIDDQSLMHVDPENLKSHVRSLSEEHLPRTCNAGGSLASAANYISDEMKKWNSNTFLQPYKIDDKDYANIVSEHGPSDAEETIIIGAHYDAHLPYPGADDNASGVAGVLELNRLLSSVTLQRRVVLVAYACEEPPHYGTNDMGSVVHATSLTDKEVILMISLEMIGYFTDEQNTQDFPLPGLSLIYPNRGNFIAVVGKIFTQDASKLKASINRSTDLEAYSINAPTIVQGIDFSDHRSYWALDYPAVMVTDTAFYRNKHYHKPTDTLEKLNFEHMAQVVYGVYVHILDLANKR